MKLYNIGVQADDGIYYLNRFQGKLIYSRSKCLRVQDTWPKKLSVQLSFCHSPYTICESIELQHDGYLHGSQENRKALQKAFRIVRLWRAKAFCLACGYAALGSPCFSDSAAGIKFFRSNVLVSQQATLCLPRALFAASMSQRFPDAGVVFIGVFLPSRSMHAWIIEDGHQPDKNDSMWVNFRPVAAIC